MLGNLLLFLNLYAYQSAFFLSVYLSACQSPSQQCSSSSSSPHLSVCQKSTLTGSIAEVLICLSVFLSLYPSMTHSEPAKRYSLFLSICLSPSLTLTASVAVVLICLSVCLRHSSDSRHSVSPDLSDCLSVTHLDSQRSGSPHQIHHHSRPGRRISCFVTDTGCGSGRQTILCNIEALAWSYL